MTRFVPSSISNTAANFDVRSSSLLPSRYLLPFSPSKNSPGSGSLATLVGDGGFGGPTSAVLASGSDGASGSRMTTLSGLSGGFGGSPGPTPSLGGLSGGPPPLGLIGFGGPDEPSFHLARSGFV